LKKTLYGLKQAPHAWYERLSKFLIKNDFSKEKIDTTLVIKHIDQDLLLVQIYVDDIFLVLLIKLCVKIVYKNVIRIWNKSHRRTQFLFWFAYQAKKIGIFINQRKYACELLKKFKIENSKEMSTPMSTSTKLDKDASGKNVYEKLYRGVIGSLFYLTACKPDIMFSVYLCACFQALLKESHLHTVKWIIRYMIGH